MTEWEMMLLLRGLLVCGVVVVQDVRHLEVKINSHFGTFFTQIDDKTLFVYFKAKIIKFT